MSASTKVDPQMVLDLLNAADCDEWKDPSVREMFRLVALGFRQVLAERDEPACSGYRHEAKAGVCWPVGANQKLRSVEAVCGNRYTPKGTMSSKACTLPRLHDGSCGQRKT